jgi:hypothetical protein
MEVLCLCLVRKMGRVSSGWAGVFRLGRAGLFVPPSQEYTSARPDSLRPTTNRGVRCDRPSRDLTSTVGNRSLSLHKRYIEQWCRGASTSYGHTNLKGPCQI